MPSAEILSSESGKTIEPEYSRAKGFVNGFLLGAGLVTSTVGFVEASWAAINRDSSMQNVVIGTGFCVVGAIVAHKSWLNIELSEGETEPSGLITDDRLTEFEIFEIQ